MRGFHGGDAEGPPWYTTPMKLILVTRQAEAPDVESFVFRAEEPVAWKAGQFFHYVLHHEPTDDRGSDRWFTVAAAPSERTPIITTRSAGEKGSSFKKALFAMKPGDAIEVSACEGDFTFDEGSPDARHVFIAGGIGITPFRAILKDLDDHNATPRITLIYANRDANAAYREELEKFAAKNPHMEIVYVIAPDRIDVPKIASIAGDLKEPIFYVSGPEPMVEDLGSALSAAGVPAAHLKQDWFPGYPAE